MMIDLEKETQRYNDFVNMIEGFCYNLFTSIDSVLTEDKDDGFTFEGDHVMVGDEFVTYLLLDIGFIRTQESFFKFINNEDIVLQTSRLPNRGEIELTDYSSLTLTINKDVVNEFKKGNLKYDNVMFEKDGMCDGNTDLVQAYIELKLSLKPDNEVYMNNV